MSEAAAPEAPWWTRAVVYQIWPRSFSDSDGDGVGDLRGVVDRLDHLALLGVDVIWLSPIYRSPQDDAGYDISDYQDVDPVFGTLDDLDHLLAEVHARGMRLVMDLVVNHTSDEHAWFAESRSSVASPRRDWYWWRDPRPGHVGGEPGAEPTNWGSAFSGPAWTWDEATGQYYLHLFSRKQPDLNWENPEVREAVYSMMRWWLDRGVDGFRMDVINFISKTLPLTDAPVPDGATLGDAFDAVASGPRIHELLAEMRREVFDGRDGAFLTVGEMPGVTPEDAVLFTDPERREVDMVFQFEHVGLDHGPGGKWDPVPLPPTALRDSLSRWQLALADRGWNSLYWDNHDQPRAVSRFGDDGEHRVVSAKSLATLLHLHRGTPYVYQGEELGMANAPLAEASELRDIESINHLREQVAAGRDEADVLASIRPMARDNARTPVQWDGSLHAGFTAGEPWAPVNPDAAVVNAAAEHDDPDSVFHHYRRLVALRHDDPVVALGDFALVGADDRVYAFTRTLGDSLLLVVVNLSGDEVPAPPGAGLWHDAELVIGVRPDGADPVVGRTLAPWESQVWRREVAR
ncbi:alpha-glucosidase [Solicola sp. PLA-1-18]|uniref:alpha-glucosidase n=1 Tax=Solicola sp. PLA-1-18 TaxID=3380532 RepID=UPI003B804038